MAEDLKRITVAVDVETHKLLKMIALEQDKKLSDVVVEALKDKVKKEGK